MDRNPYEILGVSHSADIHEVKRAYAKRLRELQGTLSSSEAAVSVPDLDELRSAYLMLSDPTRRSEYDSRACQAKAAEKDSSLAQTAGLSLVTVSTVVLLIAAGPLLWMLQLVLGEVFSGGSSGGGAIMLILILFAPLVLFSFGGAAAGCAGIAVGKEIASSDKRDERETDSDSDSDLPIV